MTGSSPGAGDDKDLFLIRVEDNKVWEEVLRPADSRLMERELLAYESSTDKQREGRPRRRRSRRSDGGGKGSSAADVVVLRPSDA